MNIPKSQDAYKILQGPEYQNMGDISWKTGETWGILFSGVAVGLLALTLFNRYYKGGKKYAEYEYWNAATNRKTTKDTISRKSF